jgi:2,3-dihydroxybenzoate decarboxylase
MEMGIDRIMFSVDYPFVRNRQAMEWMKTVPLCAADKEKMFCRNAELLFRL